MFGFVALVLDDCSLITNSMPHIDIWFTSSHVPSIVALIPCLVSMSVSLCFECVLMAFHDACKLALFLVGWNWFPSIKNSKKVTFKQWNPVPSFGEPVPIHQRPKRVAECPGTRVPKWGNRFPCVFFFPNFNLS